MSDGGMKVVINTQELSSKDKAELMELHNNLGWFMFSVTEIKEENIPDELNQTL